MIHQMILKEWSLQDPLLCSSDNRLNRGNFPTDGDLQTQAISLRKDI